MVYVATGLLLLASGVFALRSSAFDGSAAAAFALPWGIAFVAAGLLPSPLPIYLTVAGVLLVATALIVLGSLVSGIEAPGRVAAPAGVRGLLAAVTSLLLLVALVGLIFEILTRREALLLGFAEQLLAGEVRRLQIAGEWTLSVPLRLGIASLVAASALAGMILGLGGGVRLAAFVVAVNLLYAGLTVSRAGTALNLLIGIWTWVATVGGREAGAVFRRRLPLFALALFVIGAFMMGVDYLRAAGRIEWGLMLERLGVQAGSSVHALGYRISEFGLGRQDEMLYTWLQGPLSQVFGFERTVGLYVETVPVTERLAPNVYSAFRPLVEDFGWALTLLALLGLGILLPVLRRYVGAVSPLAAAALTGWVLATLSWSPVTMPTYLTTWWLGLLLVLMSAALAPVLLRWLQGSEEPTALPVVTQTDLAAGG